MEGSKKAVTVKKYYQVSEVANLIGMNPNRMYYLSRQGRLPVPAYKRANGRRLYYTAAQVEEIKRMVADGDDL